MTQNFIREQLEDFRAFSASVNIKAIIAAADGEGKVQGCEKELYALAILRALERGDFGRSLPVVQSAVSALWERGYRSGFTQQSFNTVIEEYFHY